MLVTLHLSRDNDCDEFMYGLPEHFHSFNMEEYVVLFSTIFKKLIIIIIISYLCFWDLYSLVHINYNGSVTSYIGICYHVVVYFIPLLKNSSKQLYAMLLLLFLSVSLEPISVRTLPAPIVLISVMSDLHIMITNGHSSVHIMSYQWHLIQLINPSLNCFFSLNF